MGCVQSNRFLSAEEHAACTRSKEIDHALEQDRKSRRKSRKILLLGSSDSAKDAFLEAVLKNMKMHTEGITEEEKAMYKRAICRNVVDGMVTITSSMQEAGIDFEFPERADAAQRLLELSKLPELSFSSELVELLKRLWSDAGVRSCFNGVASSKITSNVKHFLNSGRLEFVGQSDYCLTDSDILWAKGTISSNTLWETRFSYRNLPDRMDWIIIQMGGSLTSDRHPLKKHSHHFSDLGAIVFCVDLANVMMAKREEKSVAESFGIVSLLAQRLKKPVVVLLNKTKLEENLQMMSLSEALPGPPAESDAAAVRYITEQFPEVPNNIVYYDYQEEMLLIHLHQIHRTILQHRTIMLMEKYELEDEVSTAAVICGCACIVCLLPCWLPCACIYLMYICCCEKEADDLLY